KKFRKFESLFSVSLQMTNTLGIIFSTTSEISQKEPNTSLENCGNTWQLLHSYDVSKIPAYTQRGAYR
ncbi:hypothetical protein CGJ15_24520, partial [Vibrio parahaemolyticus]